MNLFGTLGHIGQLHQRGDHDRSRPHQFRWLMGVNTAVWCQSKVFAQYELLRKPISSTNFAIFDVLCARIRSFAF